MGGLFRGPIFDGKEGVGSDSSKIAHLIWSELVNTESLPQAPFEVV